MVYHSAVWFLIALACVAPPAGEQPVEPVLPGEPAEPAEIVGPGAMPFRAPLPNVVVVIGAGVSGMTAAIEAADQGAKVVLLERESDVGGAAEGAQFMLFSGSPEEAAAGIVDSPAVLLEEWPSFTGGDVSDPWVQYFAYHNVPDVHDWLAERGVSWGPPFPDASGGTVARVHSIVGRGPALVDALYAHLPAGALRLGVEATGLQQDSDGRVIGVDWADVATGESGTVWARGVVVATGGFGWNLERVREARPELQDVVLTRASWKGADGNGLAMVEGIGGATKNIDAVGLYSHSSRCPLNPELEMLVPFLSMVPWVGMSGQRLVDETAVNDLRTSEKIVAAGGAAWMAFDLDAAFDDSLCGSESADAVYYSPDELVDLGFARRADNLTDLAAAIGVDADAFAATILDYNEATAGLHEDAYRDDMHGARPVIRAPMYAMPVAVSPAKMFGGVEVDLQGRVLAVDGHVIRGLYASGELTGMAGGSLVGDAGFTGSLSAVVLGGRVAGAHAATDPILSIYK